MDAAETHARAVIAAALITSGAVETPRMPADGHLPDAAGLRLRELTDYVYRVITAGEPRDPM